MVEDQTALERSFKTIQLCRGLGALVALGAISTLSLRSESGQIHTPQLPVDWATVIVNVLSFLSPYIVRDIEALYEYRPAVRMRALILSNLITHMKTGRCICWHWCWDLPSTALQVVLCFWKPTRISHSRMRYYIDSHLSLGNDSLLWNNEAWSVSTSHANGAKREK